MPYCYILFYIVNKIIKSIWLGSLFYISVLCLKINPKYNIPLCQRSQATHPVQLPKNSIFYFCQLSVAQRCVRNTFRWLVILRNFHKRTLWKYLRLLTNGPTNRIELNWMHWVWSEEKRHTHANILCNLMHLPEWLKININIDNNVPGWNSMCGYFSICRQLKCDSHKVSSSLLVLEPCAFHFPTSHAF